MTLSQDILAELAEISPGSPLAEARAVREEVLGSGEDWSAAAAPYGKREDADADAAWIPAAWREEDGTP